jgi:hypothetical protein
MARHRWLGGLAAGLILSASLSGAVVAQQEEPPTQNQGPMFGQWHPGATPPAAANPVVEPEDRDTRPGALGAPAPGAPAPAPPPPAPNQWSGCNYNMSGTWYLSGWETQPTAFHYTGTLQIQQYGQWLQVTQEQGGAITQYYGQCTGNQLRLDVYSGGQFIGYQYGYLDWGGRWGAMRAHFNWNTWAPNYATGNENWSRQLYY